MRWSGPASRRNRRRSRPTRSRGRRLSHRHGCVDQSEMDKALRNVPQELTGVLIHFLGVEADIVGYTYQLVHQLSSVIDASGSGQSVDEPERAAEEGSLASRQAILAAVAVQQRPVTQLAPDRVDRGGHPRIAFRRVVHQRTEQQAGVELTCVWRSHVTAELL